MLVIVKWYFCAPKTHLLQVRRPMGTRAAAARAEKPTRAAAAALRRIGAATTSPSAVWGAFKMEQKVQENTNQTKRKMWGKTFFGGMLVCQPLRLTILDRTG